MISKRKFGNLPLHLSCRPARLAVCAIAALILASPLLPGQTVGTGSIVGFVADNKGAAVADAKVEITNRATAARIHVTTSAEGLYSSGPIQPGEYTVRISALAFAVARLSVVVHVGNTTTGNITLEAGAEKPPVAGGTTVNIELPTVQAVINPELADQLPVNARNYLDLARLGPDVQIQDAGVLDPGKNGISGVSILNQFGRGTKFSVDGVQINDETVGANTQNIPTSAIQEFQISQSLLDLSTGLTSAGAVNLITRSGSDQLHGAIFGVYRGDQGAAALPDATVPHFQREQFGGDAGGTIIKDKVFWFADAERSQQNLTAAEPFVYPFDGLNLSLSEPYRDFATDERVDWNMRGSTRAFYRFNYFQNNDLRPFSSFSSAQQMRSDNNTLTSAVGVDFNTGVYAHSLRFEYLKLRSHADDATAALGGIANPIPGLGINIGAATAGNCDLSGGGAYCGGPGWLGPQQTIQSDALARYDGSRVLGEHIVRYGIEFTHLDAARRAAFSLFPQVGTTFVGTATSPDPTSYAADDVSLGNGLGFSTPKSSFGLPGGGFSPDNRIEMYVGDTWKMSPRFTLTYGLHYVRDTGRTDSDLGPLPALNQWGAGYGNRVRNPNLNFAPQFGLVWDASGAGKTVIRGGGGLFYANSLWNNLLFDSPARRPTGVFAAAPQVCSEGIAEPFLWPTALTPGSTIAGGAATAVSSTTALPTFCGGIISAVAPAVLALSSAFQAAAASVPASQPNPAFVGNALTALNPSYDILYPGYLAPRSWQANLGFEQEIRPGTVLSFDYLRDIGEHFLIGQDINHSGAARSFNQANAVAARDSAQVANGCPPGLAQATCMITKLGQAGAQAAYSAAGLDSNLQAAGGGPCSYCAFPGTNPITGNLGAVGGVDMLFPDGRSLYSGFQLKLVQRIDRPVRGVSGASFQFSYAYSKFISQVQDQDSVNLATDNDDPTRFSGPSGLARKNQISFGGTFDLPRNLKFSMVGHFFSPLPQNLLLPELTNGGEIYATDWLGSGLGAGAPPELVPGTDVGQFEHATNASNLPKVISNYNHIYGGRFTPAGACLVANSVPNNPFVCPGLISGTAVMTANDMTALGWIMPTLDSVAPNAVGIPWLKSMDAKVSWPIKLKERVTIEPSASVMNVFNFWNAYLPGNLPGASLLPGQNGVLAPNVVGGVMPGTSLSPFRANFQSGTFAMGTPRSFEFGLRVSF